MRKISNIIGIVLGLCCLVLLASPDYKKLDGSSGIFYYFAKGKTVMLNERQKEILKKERLPIEYEELTDKEKKGIQAIEEFLCYLDEKYPEETFEYEHYYLPHTDMNERVEVSSSIGQITVYRQKQHGKWVYLDTYTARCEAIHFTEAFKKELDKEFGERNWSLEVCKYSFPKDAFAEGLAGRCFFDYIIYLPQDKVTDLNASVKKLTADLAMCDDYKSMRLYFRTVTEEGFAKKTFGVQYAIEDIGCKIYENREVYFF